ncbi:unnamed protein product, partial [Oikopleura dioica]
VCSERAELALTKFSQLQIYLSYLNLQLN